MNAPRLKPFLCWLALAAVLELFGANNVNGADKGLGEYQVKAAFLYNFTKFVDWPAADAKNSAAPFVIGIVGDDPFGNTLTEIVRAETVHGRPLIIKHLRPGEALGDCQMLFISRASADHLAAVLRTVGQKPVLTISDKPGAAADGVMINFILANNSVKMEINLQRAEQSGLRISSRLLKLATIVAPINQTP